MKREEYRTVQQFLEITETMVNGNWTQAAYKCIEYGFWINDLQKHYIQLGLDYDIWDDDYNLGIRYAELAQLAAKLRNKSHSNSQVKTQ